MGTVSPKKMARTARKIDEEDAFGPNAPVESVRLQLEAMIGERNSDTASSTVVWRQTVHEYYSVRGSTKRIYLRGLYKLELYEKYRAPPRATPPLCNEPLLLLPVPDRPMRTVNVEPVE